MKKIYIAYIKDNQNIELAINFIKLILSKRNSLISITDEINNEKIENVINKNESVNCIFYSHFCPPQNIQIAFREFDIASFYEQINMFVSATYDNLDSLSTEPFDKENSEQIVGILKNNCLIFEMTPPKDLISFFVKIFFDILTQHRLKNGNKRVATMLLYKLCYTYGFFVKNSSKKDSYKYWHSNEDQIIKFIVDYENNETMEEVQNKIYEWLIDNLYIANNFK